MNRQTLSHTTVPRIDDETERQVLAIVENDARLRVVCLYNPGQQLQVIAECRDGVVTGWILQRNLSKAEVIHVTQAIRDGKNLQRENMAFHMFGHPDLKLVDDTEENL